MASPRAAFLDVEEKQSLVFELVKNLLPDPDDIATPDDIAAHTTAMEELARGETVRCEDIDWD